jgi:hypothetical protein
LARKTVPGIQSPKSRFYFAATALDTNAAAMGNGKGKLTQDDMDMLKSAEVQTSMSKKELQKEFFKFKKQFPTGGINRVAFHDMASTFLPPAVRLFSSLNCLRPFSLCPKNSVWGTSEFYLIGPWWRLMCFEKVLGVLPAVECVCSSEARGNLSPKDAS